MADKYALRRVLLGVVRAAEPAWCEVSDVLVSPDIAPRIEQGLATQEQVALELLGLVERGYLTDLRPGRAPLFRLPPAGRGQLDREDDLAEYVWGEFASKFAE